MVAGSLKLNPVGAAASFTSVSEDGRVVSLFGGGVALGVSVADGATLAEGFTSLASGFGLLSAQVVALVLSGSCDLSKAMPT